MMNQISICEALAKQNKINPFLKWMVTGDEKWVTYDKIRSWSKNIEVVQTEAKQGMYYCAFGGTEKE
ncbi:hypothetical protein TNCV_214081 [Trichonephila clavipes]|nr:hypothetical protein TNCV_214081 [Trichonephila clavipes]